ncbi:MAG: OB-fold nucleic acid binding domain-containing protein [Mycobacteriales bacterium]
MRRRSDHDHGAGSRVRRALHRLAADPGQLDAEQLRNHASALGAAPVRACGDRERVCVAGTLRAVTLRPVGGVPTVEAELWDGTASVSLVWLGRRRIGGIEPGRIVLARGRLSAVDGRRVIYNPVYELRPTAS